VVPARPGWLRFHLSIAVRVMCPAVQPAGVYLVFSCTVMAALACLLVILNFGFAAPDAPRIGAILQEIAG